MIAGSPGFLNTKTYARNICYINEEYTATDAAVHDSQAIEQLLTEKDKGLPLYADSAYSGEEQDKIYKNKEVISKVHEKGYRNKSLTETQKAQKMAMLKKTIWKR